MSRTTRIIFYILLLLPFVIVFVSIKATHGLVVVEDQIHETLKISNDLDHGIVINAIIHPRSLSLQGQANWANYRHEEKPPLYLYSTVTPQAANVALELKSDKPLVKARIASLSILDNTGENDVIRHQVHNLHERTGVNPFTEVAITMHPFSYLTVESPGTIMISGTVTFADGGADHVFNTIITINTLRCKSIITRKRWDGFTDNDVSVWNRL